MADAGAAKSNVWPTTSAEAISVAATEGVSDCASAMEWMRTLAGYWKAEIVGATEKIQELRDNDPQYKSRPPRNNDIPTSISIKTIAAGSTVMESYNVG